MTNCRGCQIPLFDGKYSGSRFTNSFDKNGQIWFCENCYGKVNPNSQLIKTKVTNGLSKEKA